MRRVVSACVLIIVSSAHAFATWSVVAVNRKTGEVAIASATCVPQRAFSRFPAKGLKDVQAIILPGLGVAAAQANVDRTRRMHAIIADQIRKGTDPARIVEMLKAEDPNHPTRQYGIVDLKGRFSGYSGASNGKQSLDRQGKVEGTEIYFSIQGNILAGDDVIESAVGAFRKTGGGFPTGSWRLWRQPTRGEGIAGATATRSPIRPPRVTTRLLMSPILSWRGSPTGPAWG